MTSAIVIGGGIAGMASAQVLSTYFDQVTLYDGGPQPQAQHLHVLMKKGQELLEGMFPGILRQLKMAGCPEIDWAQDTLWENSQGAFPRYASSVRTLSMSRTLLQDLMKANLTGVRVIHERVSRPYPDADLVVIAGGQNYPLEEHLVSEEILPIHLTYRSYVFKQSELTMGGCKQYYFQVDPPHSTVGGVICPIEDGKMMVTLIQYEKEFSACTNYEEFFSKTTDKFRSILGMARPVSEMAVYRKPTIHRRVLDMKRVTPKTIVLGDVLTSLNPVFGQGMTLSLMQAQLLHQVREPLRFHQLSQRLSKQAHLLSKTGSQQVGFTKSCLRGYLRACQHVPSLHHLFLKRLHSP